MDYFYRVKWLKVAFDFYIRSSLHVALATSSLLLVTAIRNGEVISYLSLISVFLGTFAGYNLINGNIQFNSTTKRQYVIKLISLIALITVGVLFWLFTLEYKVLASTALILSLFYMIPFWNGKSLRYFPVVKLVVVALVWTIITYYISFICCSSFETQYVGNKAIPKFIGVLLRTNVLDATQRFLLVFVLCIPFEIRDLKYDVPELKTLPQLFGITISKIIGIILLVLYCWIAIQQSSYTGYDITEFIIIAVTALSLIFSDFFRSDYYASFFVEAIPVLWLMLVFLF